jgi:outer membrane receptor for ferrienterochelin and colicin
MAILGRRGSARPIGASITSFLVGITLTFFAGVAEAQIGSISGTVTDSEGAPLPDVNLVIPEVEQHTRSNSEGKYKFSKIPAGTWTLRAMRAGLRKAQGTVRVEANRSATLNFEMEDSPYAMQTITVKADPRMAIHVDAKTRNVVTAKELGELPFDDYRKAIELKAGVQSYQGEIHFRAGRADEVLTIVNGVPSRNPLQAEGVDLGMLAIDQSEQVLGGMDAQYGNALSGVISLTTREGGDWLAGEVRYFTDRYGELDKSFNNFERLSVGVGGPLLFGRTNYYVSFEGTYSDTYLRNVADHKEHRFLDFIRIGNKQMNAANLSSKVTWKVSPDQKLHVELIQNHSLSSRFHNRWNRKGFVQLLSDSTPPTDGTVTRRFGTWSYYPVDSTYVPMNTADHLPVRDEAYQQLALTWRHTVREGTIYNLRASRQEWSSTEDVLDRELWEYEQRPNNYYDPLDLVTGAYYATNGDYPFYERRRTTTYTMNGDVATTVGHHSMMMGAEGSYNDLEYLFTHFPNVLNPNGDYGATRDEFRSFNPEGSLFVQDRWRHEGMVLNAGIRYDTFSVGGQVSQGAVLDPVKTQWSPRIGIAYPITDRDVMSFHYGRLFQVPDRLFIYQGRNISAQARGNPNLEPQTTIAYQLGVQHLFTDEIYGQFSVYFKDIFGLLATVDQEVPGFAVTVPTYVNGDYASARGIEVTLIKNHSHGFGGEINYTYGNATGTASDPNRALASAGNLRDQYKPTSEQPLEWDQRHNFSASLRLGDEKHWGATFVYQFGSGFPFTPEKRSQRRQDPTLINSGRLPHTSTLSVQAERLFPVWGQDVTFYLQATNLLDARNINDLQPALWPNNGVNPNSYAVYYTETGRAGGAFLTQDRDGDGQDDWYAVNDPSVFQQGRVIRAGVGVRF